MFQRAANVPVRTHVRNATLYAVSFLASEVSTALGHQDEAIVASITRSSDGVYVLALAPRYKRIYPAGAPNVEKTGDWNASVYTIVEGGNASNALTVETSLAGTPDDPEAVVTVLLYAVLDGGG